MNHKQFLNKIDREKNMFDLENLIILSEYDYDLKDGRHGEVDRAYINRDKKYAYVIEFKAKDDYKTNAKALQQCAKDVVFIHEKYHIPKNRIFKFTAFGEGKYHYKIYHIKC